MSEAAGGRAATEAPAGAVVERPAPVGWRWPAVAGAVHAVVFAPIILDALFRPTIFPSLWLWHAARIPETFRVPWRPVRVHFGWAASSRLVDAVLPTSDPRVAGAIVSLVAAAAFGASLWWVLSRRSGGASLLGPGAALAASLGIALLETPAAIQGWIHLSNPDRSFLPLYYSFVPTTLAAMGLNVLATWWVAQLLTGRASDRAQRLLPLVLVAAAVAKPNLVPTLMVVATGWALLDHRSGVGRSDLRTVLRRVTLPVVVISVLQWVVISRLSSPDLQGTVELRPLYELRALGGFGWQFWLGLVLPVAALVLLRRLVLADPLVVLGMGCFLLGLIASLLLARAGSTTFQGAEGGDILQLAGTGVAIWLIFTLRRIVVLAREGALVRWIGVVLAVLLVPYVVAGAMTYRCHAGLARCYPPSVAPTWPQPPLENP